MVGRRDRGGNPYSLRASSGCHTAYRFQPSAGTSSQWNAYRGAESGTATVLKMALGRRRETNGRDGLASFDARFLGFWFPIVAKAGN
jgi:hypothetical protein